MSGVMNDDADFDGEMHVDAFDEADMAPAFLTVPIDTAQRQLVSIVEASALYPRHRVLNSFGPSGQLRHHFQIRETINFGSFGKVKHGYDLLLGRDVVLKFIGRTRPDYAEADLAANLDREATSMSLVDSPHVVKVFAKYGGVLLPSMDPRTPGVTVDYSVLVLEYCRPLDLYGFLIYSQIGYMSELVVRHYAFQLLTGLDACHKANVVWLDGKVDNLLLSSNSFDLKLGDFGLCQHLGPPPSSRAPAALGDTSPPRWSSTLRM